MSTVKAFRPAVFLSLLLSLVVFALPATAEAESMVSLGTARGFAVLAGSTITNTGSTVINGTAGGDIGVSAGSAITGFPPGASGTQHSNDAAAIQAQTDLVTAYNDAAGRTVTQNLTGQDLGGLTLVAGVYKYDNSAQLTGNVTLDGAGNPNSVFIFLVGTTLTTASNSSITFINGAQACHVFWVVGSSATLGTTTDFAGHIMAMVSITLNTGATVDGQLLARTGAVTLDTNTIANNRCRYRVSVSKTLAPGQNSSVLVGDTVSYVIVVTNSGDATLTVVPLADTYDSTHLDFLSASPSPDATSTGTLNWDDLTGAEVLAPDQSATVTATFRVTAAGPSVVNTATVSGAFDVNEFAANDTSSTATIGAFAASSLVVTKTADPANGTLVVPGQTITYTMGYTNSSPTTVTAASLVDALSAAVSYVPGSLVLNGVPIADTGNYNALTHTVDVSLAPVPPGASGTLRFRVTVGPFDVSRAGIENVGSFVVSGTVAATTTPVFNFVNSLDIAKTVRNLSGTVVRTGSVLQWTIVVTNHGIVPATNVVVTDGVPPHTTYVNGSITGPGADASNAPALRWNVGTIPVGGSVTLTFKSSVNSNTADGVTISNRAFVRADQAPLTGTPVVSVRVSDTVTALVRTSGDENITVGLMCLLGAAALGFVWRGRPSGPSTGRRGARITAALLLSTVLALGGMEASASFGLAVPSPGEAIAQATQSVMALASGRSTVTVGASGVSGRLTIPRIGVNQKLVEGRTMSALDVGLWRQPTSVKPGNAGACVIAGHRISSEFAKLGKARVGDTVWVTYGRSTYKYRVASVSTLDASGAPPTFRIGTAEKLVLYTCLPRWQGNKRTVVVCYRAR